MLPRNAWRQYEPRFGFPVFKDVRSLVCFSIHPNFTPLTGIGVLKAAKGSAKLGVYGLGDYVGEYSTLLLAPNRAKRMKFRIIITTRDGVFLSSKRIPGTYPPGGSVDIDVTEIIEGLGLPNQDYMAILVMSRGRPDGFRSSPGAFSMTYTNDNIYTTYRTGGFARVLNDPRRKKHYGFRGINPLAVANEQALSSILLINHSSNPAYDSTVTPTSILLCADGEKREASFGPISPFGGVERSLEDLFGDDVIEFLAPYQGRGTVITTCPAVTLASIHVMRKRDGSSMSIEHSRPTHTYLLHGV